MYIKILKVTNKCAWYAKEIGRVLEVSDALPYTYLGEGDIRILESDDIEVIETRPVKIIKRQAGFEWYQDGWILPLTNANILADDHGSGFSRYVESFDMVDIPKTHCRKIGTHYIYEYVTAMGVQDLGSGYTKLLPSLKILPFEANVDDVFVNVAHNTWLKVDAFDEVFKRLQHKLDGYELVTTSANGAVALWKDSNSIALTDGEAGFCVGQHWVLMTGTDGITYSANDSTNTIFKEETK